MKSRRVVRSCPPAHVNIVATRLLSVHLIPKPNSLLIISSIQQLRLSVFLFPHDFRRTTLCQPRSPSRSGTKLPLESLLPLTSSFPCSPKETRRQQPYKKSFTGNTGEQRIIFFLYLHNDRLTGQQTEKTVMFTRPKEC